ncbi:MAG: TonB-dependent siderophore receptor [Pseudoxanthomonas sp.]
MSAPAVAQSSPNADEEATTLDALRVKGQRGANTEGSGTYGAQATTVFKGLQSVRQTPQPVTVISRQMLDDRVLLDMHDVLQNTPGVTVDYVDSERVNYFSRGFQIDNLQIDGMLIDQGGSLFIQPDTSVLDRVEVLRGAAGLLRGAGNPSATVNLVRKRPTDTFRGSAGLSLGSWDRRRIEGDIGGPLNKAGTLRGRIVATYDERDFFQHAKQEERHTVYGVLEADLTDNTLLTFSLQQSDLYATGAWGNLPPDRDGSQLDFARSTYFGADWNRWNRYNQQVFIGLEHRFDNAWSLRLNAAHNRFGYIGDFKQTSFSFPRVRYADPYLADVSTAVYSNGGSHQNVINLTGDGPFELFGRRHHLTVGVEGRNVATNNTSGYFNIAPMTGVDLRQWDPYTSYPEPLDLTGATYYAGIDNSVRQEAVFALARLSLADPLTAMVGARANWYDYTVPTNPGSSYSIDHEVTPYAGLVYDISKHLSVYTSYSEIFTPQAGYTADGGQLAPITGEDYEAGVKGEFFGGRLNGALSLFRINNVGRAMDDADTPNPCLPYYPSGFCKMAGGKTRSEGWELELSGDLTPNWQVMAGYTNTKTEYLRDPSAANVGKPIRELDPRHLLRVFSSYRLPGVLRDVRLGGGVQAQSETRATSGQLVAHQSGYAVWNLMASYDLSDNVRLQLNANNVFDKVYYSKVNPSGWSNYYGNPRNLMFSVQARF